MDKEIRICSQCGQTIPEPPDVLALKDVLILTPEEEQELTEQVRQEEGEESDRSAYAQQELEHE